MTCGSFFKMRVDPKEQQARPYRKFLTWLIALQGLIILLATVEIFWAFGDPERFLGELFTTELTAGDIQQVMLFHFFRQIYMPAILAISSFFMLPKTGVNKTYRWIWGLLLVMQIGLTFINGLHNPVFKWSRIVLLFLTIVLLTASESMVDRERGHG